MNSGILLLDKPTGSSSAKALYPVKRTFPGSKVGHTGTLDPFASGLLVVLIGHATRLSRYFLKLDKKYTATMKLGEETDTLDRMGTVTDRAELPDPNRMQAEIHRFKGTIVQQPPRYSALKVQGKRAYQLARQGIEPELAPRQVSVYSLSLSPITCADLAGLPSRYTLEVHCGSGTYIRALARDIGLAVGSRAFLEELRRTQVGPFTVAEAHPERLITIPDALRRLGTIPIVPVDAGESDCLRLGKALDHCLSTWTKDHLESLSKAGDHSMAGEPDSYHVLLVDSRDREVALIEDLRQKSTGPKWRYTAVFSTGNLQ